MRVAVFGRLGEAWDGSGWLGMARDGLGWLGMARVPWDDIN